MVGTRREFGSVYLTRFASSLGYVTLLTLLPTYINLLDPSGLVIGLFTTALTLTRGVAVIPLGWAGDRFDKRTVLTVSLAVSSGAYLVFTAVDSSASFIGARSLQGLGIVGTGLISLALLSELAPDGERAKYIGRYNAVRMSAGIAGTLGAGAVYQFYGFGPIFVIIAGMLAAAAVSVWLFVEPDDTTVDGFAFTDLAVNRRILTLSSFRAQYAFAVMLVRTWVPIYAGVAAAKGGLGYGAFVVGAVLAAEQFANMVCQPYTGRLSDRYGRALFVFVGGGLYGLVALAVPFSPAIGAALGLDGLIGGPASAALVPLLVLNALLGAADSVREPASMALFADEGIGSGIASSFGIRAIVWRPGAILAPMLGGVLMTDVSMASVFFVGGGFALVAAVTFGGLLARAHGRRGLTSW